MTHEAVPRDTRPLQGGQVLVLFVGGLFLLLAIAALVVDLGFAFMLRRQEQNAVDPGAIAAARYIRATGNTADMRRAACGYARENGFFDLATSDDGCTPANDSFGAVLTVNYPPGPSAGSFAGRQGFVEVAITRVHQTFFARLLPMASINVTSSAVAAFSNGDSNTASMIALDPITCASGKVSGGGEVEITPVYGVTGGYIHVNSECGDNPPSAQAEDNVCTAGSGGFKIDGGGTVTSPGTFVHGTCQATVGTLVGPLDERAVQIGDPLGELAPPRISDHPPGQCGPTGVVLSPTGPNSDGCRFNTAGVIQLEPGVYYGGWDIRNNVTLELASGVYIMAGGGIKLNAGGSITSVTAGGSGPAPVLIFNTDNPAASCPSGTAGCQGAIDLTAQSTLKLRAIDYGPYKGILLWQDGAGSDPDATVTLGGQTELDIAGTIYAPKALVKLDGGSDLDGVASVQIISWQWEIVGQGSIDIPYDPNELYRFDQKGLVR